MSDPRPEVPLFTDSGKGIDPCARCGWQPIKVSWDCPDAPRIIHPKELCDHVLAERKCIDEWNSKQREATRDTPF